MYALLPGALQGEGVFGTAQGTGGCILGTTGTT